MTTFTKTAFTYLFVLAASLLCNYQGLEAQNVIRAEYYVDNDPGFGNASNIPVTAGVDVTASFHFNTDTMAAGFHSLFIRALVSPYRSINDGDTIYSGGWSLTSKRTFYKEDLQTGSATLANIVKGEYFIDTDPGFGNGSNITVPTNGSTTNMSVAFNIALDAITPGFHRLYTRFKDANNNWSLTSVRTFYKEDVGGSTLPPSNITSGEYFVDADPGFGAGSNIALTAGTNLTNVTFAVSIDTMSAGFHNLFTRFKDVNGKWGLTNRRTFYKENLSTTGSAVPNIVAGEYFIDTDPGFGRGTGIPVNTDVNPNNKNLSFVADITTLAEGFHRLYSRFKDANGTWGHTNTRTFYKTSSSAFEPVPDITGLEYFIDTDPGFGKGIKIPVTPGANINNLTFTIPDSVSTVGNHQIYIRAQNAKGHWSLTNIGKFTKQPPTALIITLGNVATTLCAGGNVSVPFSVNLPFGSNNVFTAQLSNSNGQFANPVNIGTLTGNNSDTVRAVIPAYISQGNRYRIRVISSSPTNTSGANTTDITINAQVTLSISIAASAANICVGTPVKLIATANGNVLWSTGQTGDTITVSPTRTATYAATVTNAAACTSTPSATATFRVNVFGSAPAGAPSVTASTRQLYATAPSASDSITGYQWYKDGVAIAGETNSTYYAAQDGSYTVSFVNSCGTGTQSAPVIVSTKQSQTITFDSIPDKTFGDAPFKLNAIASSGLAVTYSIIGGSASVQGDTVTISGAGVITVRAYQAGNSTYNAAYADKAFTVDKAAATVTLSDLTKVYNGLAQSPTIVTNPSGLSVSVLFDRSGTTPVNAGSYHVVASVNNSNYSGADSGTFIIQKANQTITLEATTDKEYGNPPFTITTASSSGLPVSLSITTTPAGIATIAGNTITIAGTGTVFVSAVQTGNGNYNPAAEVKDTFLVNKATQTITLAAISDKFIEDTVKLNASVSSGLPFTYSITTVPATGVAKLSGDTITFGGDTGRVTVTVSQAGNNFYNPAQTQRTFKVLGHRQTITFAALPAKTLGDAPFAVSATSTSGLAVTFKIVSGPATVSANTITLTGAGTVVVEANQAGNNFYAPAVPVQQSFAVGKSLQSITFNPPGDFTYGSAPINLFATATSGLPVSFTVVSGPATVSGKALTSTGVGTVTIKATQPGNTNYNAAADVTQTLCINTGVLSAIAGLKDICPGTQTYSTTFVTGATYTWSVSGSATKVDAANTTAIQFTTPGTYTIIVKAKGNCELTGWADTATVVVKPPVTPGIVQNMLPADSSKNLTFPVNLSWQPAANADHYDVFLWPDSISKPVTPFITNTADINVPIGSGLKNGVFYRWQVVSKNNCLSTQGPSKVFTVNNTVDFPDLTVSNVQYPVNAVAGQNLTVSWKVNNIGVGSTNSAQWSDYVYLSTDKDLRIGDDILLGKFDNQSYLQPGQSYNQTRTVNLPGQLTGTYYLFVITDNQDAYCWTTETCETPGASRGAHNFGIKESNENNNYQYSLVTIDYGNLADLRVVSVATPSVVFGGNNINVNYKVTNIGTVAATGTTLGSCPQRGWYDRVFISPDSIFSSAHAFEYPLKGFFREQELTNCQSNTNYKDYVLPDSSYSRIRSVQIPFDYYGTYYIYVFTNGFNEAYEGPYKNNNILRSDPITVNLTPPADLVVSRVQVPSAALSGQQINVSFTVTNAGANAPRESYWNDNIYLSVQNVFNPANVTKIAAITHVNAVPFQPNTSYIVNQQITVPNGISGTYYVFVRTDADNQVFEYNNENNNDLVSAPVAVTLSPAVDLTVTKITAPDTVKVDNSFSFMWHIKNQGVATAPGFADYIYCSLDSALSSNLYILGSYTHTGTFLAGLDSAFTTPVTVPATFGGKKVYFFVTTDVLNQVYEHNAEDNNRGTSASPQSSGNTYVVPLVVTAPVVLKPDVKVQSVTAPSSALSGSTQTVNWQVINAGQGTTPVSSWTDGIYLSADSILDGGDQNLATSYTNAPLTPGSSYTRSASIQLPYTASGNYYLLIAADVYNTIYNDSVRSNNIRVSPIAVTLAPGSDLVISSVGTLPSPLFAGSQFYLKYSVTNTGTVTTNVSSWYDGAYFNTSQIPSGSQSGSQPHNDVLNPGQSYTDSILVTVPSYLSGNYYFIFRTDNSSNVYEGIAGKSNNTIVRAVNIQPLIAASKSDLIVSALSVPDSALLGKPMTAGYTVKNIGSNPALNSFTNAFYLSSNKTFEGSAAQLVKAGIISTVLNPGASVTASLTGTVFVPVAGNYFGIARTNILNTVSEDSITNNMRASDTTIHIDAANLTLNIAKNDTVNPSYVNYYKVDVSAGLDLLVTLTSSLGSSAGTNTLYMAYNRVPTVFDYDATGIDATTLNQQLLLSGTKAGTYYIRIESKNINANEPVTVLAKTLPFSIVKITPAVAGQYFVNTDLFGAGFKDSSRVYLKTSAGTVVSQAKVLTFVNSTRLKLKWDFRSVALGTYDVVVVNPDASQVKLIGGMKVVASSGYALDFVPLMPNQIRRNQTGLFSFKAVNKGNVNIPFVHGDFTLPGYVNIKNVIVQGKVKKQSQYHPDTVAYKRPDYNEQGNTKVIPFICKDLAPGEEFIISFYLSNFTQSSFPIRPRVFGYSTNEFAREQIGKLELLREAILQKPLAFGLTSQNVLLIKASDRDTFINGMLNNYYEAGFLTPADVVGIDPSCPACLLQIDTATLASSQVYNFNSGSSPALTQLSHDTTFAGGESYLFKINKSLYWPGYTGSVGVAGQNPGWDLMRVNGKLNITSTSTNPFTVSIASLSYQNRPALLAGWYPAKDTSFAMIIAAKGIQNFSADKFVIDATLFQRYNNTYGGYFYLRLNKSAVAGGADTLYLGFKAHVPGIGENGVPGAPGAPGEPGSPGGQGGPGNGTIPPGNGGAGGKGGDGAPGGPGGNGGNGGNGGTGTSSQGGGNGGSGGNGGNGGSGGGNGGNGGIGGSGGSGGSNGNGGNGGNGGNSGGGSGSGGNGGSGGSGSSGGNSGGNGGGSGGSGGSGGDACSQSSSGNQDLCNDLIDLIKISNSDDAWKDLGWFSAGKLGGDNCVAGSFVSCAEAAVDAVWDFVTLDWWGSGTDALSCGLKIGDCINQGIYGTKDYPGSDIVKDLINGAECIGSLSDLGACVAKQILCTPVVSSCDPNEIIGPPSYGAALMVSNKATLPYSIHFENDSSNATTAAQKVVIRQKIDKNLNPLSFRAGNFSFANRTFSVGSSQSSYFSVLDLADSLGFNVEVTAGVDVVNRELVWVFQTIDAQTGLPPANPLVGFLPINNADNAGQGYVNYTIKPNISAVTGDTITAKANIFFDTNDPIPTNKWLNTIDAVAPVSKVDSFSLDRTVITLKWHGSDDIGGSGLKSYSVYVSQNGDAFYAYQVGLTDATTTFNGSAGNTYRFFTIATDNVDNQEAMKDSGEVTVIIPGNDYYRSIVSGSWNNPATWQSSADSITWVTAAVAPSDVSKTITIQNGHTINVTASVTTDETIIQPGGALTVAAAQILTVLNNGLTLKSNAVSTAMIGISGGTITGNVTVERYIPARRAWRLLSVPFSAAQTISSSWQEGGLNIPGYGTHITGGTVANGFDVNPGNTSSIKKYNAAANILESLTSTLLPLTDQAGYMLFVRGDRTIDLSVGTSAPATNTVLRAMGTLKMGTQPNVTVPATGFTLVGNPYAAPVDFTRITKTNIPDRFYLWDPKRATVGAYVLFDAADGYVPLTSDGSYTGANSVIQSGQAFFVQGSGTAAGSLQIAEVSKSVTQQNVFRTNDGNDEKLQINLRFVNADNTTTIADAAAGRYNNLYAMAVTAEDAGKLDNIDENIAIVRDGTRLTIERRPLIDDADTMFLKIYNMKLKSYQFEITPVHFTSPALTAFLEDSYLKTRTPVSLEVTTTVQFSVTGDTASANADRFRIVFATSGALPVSITSVKAYQKNDGIQVDWNVSSEINIDHYEVEKSGDGQNFSSAAKVAATGNSNSSVSYNWFDPHPFDGNNFFRIKSVENTGSIKLSQVVVVSIGNAKRSIVIYPNPVTDRVIMVQLNNQPKGKYLLQLYNSLGQRLLNKTIIHPGGSATQTVPLTAIVSKGVYQLYLTSGDDKITQQLIVQ